MGTLYFIIKNTIVTVVLVCLLQLRFGSISIEERIMTWVRGTLASKVLGQDTSFNQDLKTFKLGPEHVKILRERLKKSEFMDVMRSSAKQMLKEEMNSMMRKDLDQLDNIEGLEGLNNKEKKD